MPNIVVLSDRIKEISHTTGTANMVLDQAATGFSAFNEFYSDGDAVYYAITDGSSYEVGSGVYLESSDRQLQRFPFRSKLTGNPASTGLVNFPAGAKEIYVTYPASYSVYTASGIDPSYQQPQASGLAFWESPNILNYDPSIIWDSTNNRLGLNTDSPAYAIDIGGDGTESQIRSSGVVVGTSGVLFPSGSPDPGYVGGRQVEHFIRNEIDSVTGSDEVLQLSGVVDQAILFTQQSKGQVFAGPPSGCGVGCSPAYPSFRYLTIDDLPDLTTIIAETADYVTQDGTPSAGYVAVWHDDNVITFDTNLFFDTSSHLLGINTSSPIYTLDVHGTARISSKLVVEGTLDVQGTTTYIDSSNVTIWDKHLELASMSGEALYRDALIDGAGIIVKSSGDGTQGSPVTDGSVDKKWVWTDATDAWTTDQKIDVSGVVGDMFDLGTSPAQGVQLHDTIWVSGVSGVETSLEQIGTNHVLWVDPTELSGVLQGQILSATSAGSGLISYSDGSFNLNSPSGSYSELLAASAASGDSVLVWDSGSYVYTFMSLGELQKKIDTSAGGSSNTWSTIDVNDTDSGFTWGTSDVVTASAGETIKFVAGENIALASDATGTDAVRFTNTGTPIVSGMIVSVSGLLDEASGVLNGGITNTSSELVLTSGILQGTIDNLSGITHEYTAGSGFIRYADGSTPSIYSFNLNDPDVSYDAIAAGASDLGDQMLLWHDDTDAEHGWNHITLTELKAKIDEVGAGGDNAFKIITVDDADAGDWSATEDVIADTTTDTLKLVAGTGIQLNSRDSDDAIRIYSVGSHTVSGMFVSGSGALHQEILATGTYLDDKIDSSISPNGTHSGIAIFNINNELVDTYVNGSGMFWDSGNVSLSLGSESLPVTTDNISALFINTVSGDRRGLTIQASAPQDKNLFEIRGPDGNISGIYIDGNGDFVGTNAGRGSAEFFAGRNAARDAANVGSSVFIGGQAGTSAYESDYSVFLGENAGYNIIGKKLGEVNPDTISNVGIGHSALQDASGITRTVSVGYLAGSGTRNSQDSVWIGNEAGYKSSGDIQSVFIGYQAGALVTGCDYTNMIGYQAGYNSVNCSGANIMGSGAGYQAIGCETTNMIGQQAGLRGNNVTYSNLIGRSAGFDSKDLLECDLIGYAAGWDASGCIGSLMIGRQAGKGAHDITYSPMIGFSAGFEATGCDFSLMVGHYAGYRAEKLDSVVAIGRGACMNTKDMYRSILIGWQAGVSAPYVAGTCTGQDNIYIGTNAGRGHTGDNNITLLASPTYGDTFHPPEGDFSNRMSLGNTIFGITARYGTAGHTMGRMIQIGEMPERDGTDDDIGATLAVKPDLNVTQQPTMWLKKTGSQAQPILMSSTTLNYKDKLYGFPHGHASANAPLEKTFGYINNNGALCVPVFEEFSDLNETILPGDNPGAIGFVDDKMYIVLSGSWIRIDVGD